MARKRILKIYISSPDDVKVEREEAVRRVKALSKKHEYADRFEIKILRWEETPSIVGRSAQSLTDKYIGKPEDADVVICIFGRWFGTDLPMAGQDFPSGTYYEFSQAVQAHKNNRQGTPHVILIRVRKDKPKNETEEQAEQYKKVEEFFQTFRGRGAVYQGNVKECSTLEQFGETLSKTLEDLIREEFPLQKGNTWSDRLRNWIGFSPDIKRDRQEMILKVREIWIKGVLSDTTASAAAFDVPIKTKGEGIVEGPAALARLYDLAHQRLVILGDEGAGKSVMMLELLNVLLERASVDSSLPIPVVFNLSSWAAERKPFREWLASELVRFYRQSHKLADSWLDNAGFCLCLDGLDEITVAGSDLQQSEKDLRKVRQHQCLESLNEYISGTKIQVVLCCQGDEYNGLGTKLNTGLGSAATVTLEPLSNEQIDTYVKKSKWSLGSLQKALDQDGILREMARTPFLLTTMAVAYRDAPGTSAETIIREVDDGTMDRVALTSARREDLLNKYIEKRCGNYIDSIDNGIVGNSDDRINHPHKRRYETAIIRYYLKQLALHMDKEGESNQLLVDQLQPSWLPEGVHWKYHAIVGLFLFAFVTLLVGIPEGIANGFEWADGPHKSVWEGVQHGSLCFAIETLLVGSIIAVGYIWSKGWSFGIATGLAFGAARGTMNTLSRVEGGWARGSHVGLLSALVGICVFVPLFIARGYTRDRIRPLESRRWDVRLAVLGASLAVIVGVIFWLLFGPARGLGFGTALIPILTFAFGYLGTDFEVKAYPNQGIWQSAHNAAKIGLSCAICGVCCIGISYGIILSDEHGHAYGVEQGIVSGILGLCFGVVSLGFGGMPVLQHISLRYMLSRCKLAPFYYVDFLNACCKLQLMRRVGGSYKFQHEQLRIFFRDLPNLYLSRRI